MSSRAGDWARAREEEVELELIFRVFILLALDTFLGTTVGVAGAQMDTCKHGSVFIKRSMVLYSFNLGKSHKVPKAWI